MQVKHYKDGSLGTAEVDAGAFGEKVLHRTLKDAVVMHQNNQRQGNASTRTRGEVAGSRKKPWKQKHTGRARAGSRRSPIWRGGGTVFGPRPRDFAYHMPVKARRAALRAALRGKLDDGELLLVDLPTLDAPSSKAVRALLGAAGSPRRALVVLAEPNPVIWKSFRNFAGATVREAANVCAFDVVQAGVVLCEPAALEALGQRVGVATDGGEA